MNLQDLYIQPSKIESRPACFKKCSCGREYTREQWMALRPSANGSEWDTGDGIVLILRNCTSCHSTMSFEKPQK